MRVLVLILTFSLVLSFVLQWLRPKGTEAHIIRGAWILISSVSIVMLNIVSRQIIWDLPFLIHVLLGGVAFLYLIQTFTSGASLIERKDKAIEFLHRRAVLFATVFLVLTFLMVIAIGFLR